VATVDASGSSASCVEQLKGQTDGGYEDGYHSIKTVGFVGGDRQRVSVGFQNLDGLPGGAEYERRIDGSWTLAGPRTGADWPGNAGFTVAVKEGLNEPPVLVATDRKTELSRIIWNPNPQLRNVDLGEASVYQWKDKMGRNWKGGLFKPLGYIAGQRYPLVIQNHGFTEAQFRPSGIYPTAFAARALAGAGIMVLQTGWCPTPNTGTPEEGPCNVSGYEAAVRKLVTDGLVDPDLVGIIGFSRTCFYVMETLTTSSLKIKAASITDGVMENYLQYLAVVDSPSHTADEADAMIGARPFGDGLQRWLQRSPVFNMDKVTAPLQIVGESPASLLFMWEPYAALRYLHMPVDLVLLNTHEHVLTNPGKRMISQGGSVDWFRFWLQNYEDPNPSKSDQYARWRAMRALSSNGSHK